MSDLFRTGSVRRTGGNFSVAMKDGAKLARKLQRLENGSEVAIRRTVVDFSSRAPAWVSKGIREHYGVDAAAIKDAGPKKKKGATSVKVSGISVDGATLEYKGRTLTPIHFKMSPKARPDKQQNKYIKVPGQAIAQAGEAAMIQPPKRYTVKATILKGKRSSLPHGTFVAPGNGGVSLPFQRTSEARKPIEVVRTLSVPQMITGRAKETIEEMVADNLQKRFEHHIKQATK